MVGPFALCHRRRRRRSGGRGHVGRSCIVVVVVSVVVEVVAVVVLVVVAVVVVVSLLCSSRRHDRPRRVVAGSLSRFCHWRVTRGGTSSHSPACPVRCAEELALLTDELSLMPRRGWLGG